MHIRRITRSWLIALTLASVAAQPVNANDALVRLSFLLNFSRYAEWPAPSASATFNICIAPGDRELISEMSTLDKQAIAQRHVRGVVVSRASDVSLCQTLFLPVEMSRSNLAAYIEAATKAKALTVSDRPDFVDEGGMIGLVAQSGRYVFDVNLGAARQADLKLSAHLLKLARTVK